MFHVSGTVLVTGLRCVLELTLMVSWGSREEEV